MPIVAAAFAEGRLGPAKVRAMVEAREDVEDAFAEHEAWLVGQAEMLTVARAGFPGCGVDLLRCDAHHVVPWDWDGPADLANIVMLCRHHHCVPEAGFVLTLRKHPASSDRSKAGVAGT